MIRLGTLIAVGTASRVRGVVTFSIYTLHRVRTHIRIFGTGVGRIAFRTIGRKLAIARHAAIGFIRRTAGRTGRKSSAHAGLVGTLIGPGTGIPVITTGRIRGVIAFALRALHRIRTYIQVLRAVAGLDTFRAFFEEFAFAGHAAVGFVCRTAVGTWRKRTTHAGFVDTLVGACTRFAIVTTDRVSGVLALALNALHRIGADIQVFGAITGLGTFRARTRIFAFSGHAAVRLIRGTAGSTGRESAAYADFVRALIRIRTRIALAAAARIGWKLTFSADALYGIGTHIGIFGARVRRIALRTIIWDFTLPCHAAVGFVCRTTRRARHEGSAHTNLV